MQERLLRIEDVNNPSGHAAAVLSRPEDYFLLTFKAMAGTCELLIDLPETETLLAEEIARQALIETWRIENKYSRYCSHNWYEKLHRHPGEWQHLDDESARLIAFAEQAWKLSDGLFDITSGILRKAWRFDGSERVPSTDEITPLLPLIGWHKLRWQAQNNNHGAARLCLPPGMELDFGGIGKEYAVDRVLGLSLALLQRSNYQEPYSLLVNFGGDIACSGTRVNKGPWRVAIEAPDRETQTAALLSLSAGALATSGDSQRFLLKDGVRYSHLLNPKTGWPINNAARSITVAAPTCSQSGLIASLALLQGPQAETFLQQTGLKYWLVK